MADQYIKVSVQVGSSSPLQLQFTREMPVEAVSLAVASAVECGRMQDSAPLLPRVDYPTRPEVPPRYSSSVSPTPSELNYPIDVDVYGPEKKCDALVSSPKKGRARFSLTADLSKTRDGVVSRQRHSVGVTVRTSKWVEMADGRQNE